ncbi:MAG: Fis family transcriptional regulator [Thiolinea sp.]
MTTSTTRALDSSLSETVHRTLQDYLDTLGDHEASNIYRLVLDEVERPMLEVMMRYTYGNQSKTQPGAWVSTGYLRAS